MSAIVAIIGRKIAECQKEVLSQHGGEGEGREIEVRHEAARDVCSEGYSKPPEEYHQQASDRFEAQVPKTREEIQRKEETMREMVRAVLPVVFGPLVLFFRK